MADLTSVTKLFKDAIKPDVKMQFYYEDETGVSIPAFELDCVPSETFNGSTSYTKNPVQKGINISDHATHNPITLSISFIVSNFPIRIEELPISVGAGIIGGLSNSIVAKIAVSEAIVKLRELMDPEGYLRSRKAFEKIEEIRLKSVPLQIFSKRTEYQNMVITSFSVTDDVNTQDSLIGTLSFEEINIVDVSTTEVVVPDSSIDESVRAGAVEKTNGGKKNTIETDKATEKKSGSWLYNLYN